MVQAPLPPSFQEAAPAPLNILSALMSPEPRALSVEAGTPVVIPAYSGRWTHVSSATGSVFIKVRRVSAGVRKRRHFLGVVLQARTIASISLRLRAARSVLLGRRRLSRPMAFSTDPFCHGLWGSQKNVPSTIKGLSLRCPANSVPLSTVRDFLTPGG